MEESRMKRASSLFLAAVLLFVANVEQSAGIPQAPAGYQKYKPYDPVPSYQLDVEAKRGNERVLMFEKGKWQPLRPLRKNFGPEIAFGRRMAQAWPDETIGIVKQAVGGTGVLAWHPNWTVKQAARTNDARKGNLWEALTSKVQQACLAADCEIVGFIWLQGGKDMLKVDTGRQYGDNLKTLVEGIRKKFDVPKLPFVLGSYRTKGMPDDLSGMAGKVKAMIPRKGAYYVLQAQYEAEKKLAPANMVPLVDIERHPNDVHFNTAGQLKTGRLFAEGYLELVRKTNRE
jgi:hypothetical protein